MHAGTAATWAAKAWAGVRGFIMARVCTRARTKRNPGREPFPRPPHPMQDNRGLQMVSPVPRDAIDYAAQTLDQLVVLARTGHREAFRHLMQKCNQRLFRTARAVLNDDAEAEDALQ
ncbi:hypothetical protein [Solilutibacter oculi]|uniref:hypothetical protein n=1 Tax=Solilutibacter oculi TaxID=2698682 RepID=UPI001F25E03C|nr:hypothetical protein [Lysobacter oculi]